MCDIGIDLRFSLYSITVWSQKIVRVFYMLGNKTYKNSRYIWRFAKLFLNNFVKILNVYYCKDYSCKIYLLIFIWN